EHPTAQRRESSKRRNTIRHGQRNKLDRERVHADGTQQRQHGKGHDERDQRDGQRRRVVTPPFVAAAQRECHPAIRRGVGHGATTTSTRESGSSTQSTGTSWIRKPLCSASTSSSVSKNQPWSSTMGSSTSATSWRIALKPHCASENPARSVAFKSKL